MKKTIVRNLSCLTMLLIVLLQSCTLFKIESADKPLSVNDINTRYLVQSFAGDALYRNELAADSISTLSDGSQQLRLRTLQWKLQLVSQLGKLSFQPIPRVALTDTWAYMLVLQEFLQRDTDTAFFGDHQYLLQQAADFNAEKISRIAASLLDSRDYPRYKEFVESYAAAHPLSVEKDLMYDPIREAYMIFNDLPDSVGVQTVGTLSQVVDEFSNKISFSGEVLSKKLGWQAELLLKQQGLDSIPLETRLNLLQFELNRLVGVAEQSPEMLADAIKNFKENIQPLFQGLNSGIEAAMLRLSTDRAAIDSMVLRERTALDTILRREREALSKEAKEIADTGLKNALDGLNKMIRTILFFAVLALVVVLGLPFYLGYLTGKRTGA